MSSAKPCSMTVPSSSTSGALSKSAVMPNVTRSQYVRIAIPVRRRTAIGT
jgi:hypothetical protein